MTRARHIAVAAGALAVAVAIAGCLARAERASPPEPVALDDAIARFSAPADDDRAWSAAVPTPGRTPRDRPASGPPTPTPTPRPRPTASAAPRAPLDRAHEPLGASDRRVDVRLHEADLENSLRMLADAARVPIVVDGDVHGTVTIELRGVDPLRALDALAAANGARVERSGGVIVVRTR